MFKVDKPKAVQIVQEGTLLHKAHCLYNKLLRLEKQLNEVIIPTLHKNYVAAHYDYFYDEQYAESVVKVLTWNEKRIKSFGFTTI